MENGNDLIGCLREKLESLEADYLHKKRVFEEAIHILEMYEAAAPLTAKEDILGDLEKQSGNEFDEDAGASMARKPTLKGLVMEVAHKRRGPFTRIHVGEYIVKRYPAFAAMNDQHKISNAMQKLRGDGKLKRFEIGDTKNPSVYCLPEFEKAS